MGEGNLRMPAAFKALKRPKQDDVGHVVCVDGDSSQELPRSTSPKMHESLPTASNAGDNNEFDFTNNDTERQSLTTLLSQNNAPESRNVSSSFQDNRGILSKNVQTNGSESIASFTPSAPPLESRNSNISSIPSVPSVSTTNTNFHRQNSIAATSTLPNGNNNNNRLKFASLSSPDVASTPEGNSQPRLSAFASTASFQAGIDLYGFKKPTYGITIDEFDSLSARYSKYLERRGEKWRNLLRAHGLSIGTDNEPPVRFPPESQKLRRYVRKGIPPKWRGNAWFWYARGHEKLNAHPQLYEKLVNETEGLKNNDSEHIERDLHRTFPDNILFRNDPNTNEESPHLKALRRVLTCFSVYQPKVGYCQSLNFIAGNLLLFMDEERAFWMLVIITQTYLSGLHEVNLEQVNISQGILMISVRDRLPKIWNALNLEHSLEENFISNLPPISLCTAPWFMSMMVNVLPTETMLRVWDCIFLEGPKTIYRIALSIFKLAEPQLNKATDELEVFQIIQSAPKTIYDPDVLMSACFKRTNGFGHVSNEDVAMLRSFVQQRRKQALEGIDSGTSDRHAYAKLHRGRRVKAKLSLYR